MKKIGNRYFKKTLIIVAALLGLILIRSLINFVGSKNSATSSGNRVLKDAYDFQETQRIQRELRRYLAEDSERMAKMGINPDSINTPDRQSYLKYKNQILTCHTIGDTLCIELSAYLSKDNAQNLGKYIFRLSQNNLIKTIQVMNKDSSIKELWTDSHGYLIDVQHTKQYYEDIQRPAQ